MPLDYFQALMSGKQNSNYTRDHDFNIKQISWTSISYFSRALTLFLLFYKFRIKSKSQHHTFRLMNKTHFFLPNQSLFQLKINHPKNVFCSKHLKKLVKRRKKTPDSHPSSESPIKNCLNPFISRIKQITHPGVPPPLKHWLITWLIVST